MEPTQESLSTEHIIEIVGQYIREQFLYDRPEVSLSRDLPLFEQHLIDSIQLVQLVQFLQSRFRTLIDLSDLVPENFATLEVIARFMQQYQRTA
jgi:acyl carrier protein